MTQVFRAQGSPWSKLWQVPLLTAGVIVFAMGLRSLVSLQKSVPFETHVADVQQLLANKQYERAIKQIGLLQDYFTAPTQQAQLALLKGDTYYLFQQQQPAVVPENYRRVIQHYRQAVRLGMPETVVLDERWGRSVLALGDYPEAAARLERVIKTDPGKTAGIARDLVAAYLGVDPPRTKDAFTLLEKISKGEGTGVDDRVWALSKRLELGMEEQDAPLEAALADAKAAVAGIPEHNPSGALLVWIGRAEYERGHIDDAAKALADARARFVGHHVLDDGRAALLMGRIAQSRGDLPAARGYYQEVVLSHAGSVIMAAGRLGRAEVGALGGEAGEQVQADYVAAIKEVKGEGPRKAPPEMISVDSVRDSLVAQQQRFRQANRLPEALIFVDLQKQLGEAEGTDFVLRQARILEGRGDELLAQGRVMRGTDAATEARRNETLAAALDHYARAGDMYLKHSRLATMDDMRSGESLWRAALLFDKAGRTERSSELFQKYIKERPNDAQSRIPEALHRVGMLQQSMGKLDPAIECYQRNIKEHPKTTWAYASTVQLARCYMAQGDSGAAKAEETLLSVVQGNENIRPEAQEFRVSLFALGELYYRTKRWSDAILRIEEALTRYPDDAAVPKATFWVADAYRRSAGEIADAIRKDASVEGRDQLEQARMTRLRRAASLFGQVVTKLEPDPGQVTSEGGGLATALEEDYLRCSYLYRADCHYELGEHATAVKLYDQAAARFAQSTTAVEAYVQIINSYLAMKEPAQAAAAAERARWLLKRLPDDAFGRGPVALSRQQYEDYLKLGKVGN